MSCLSIKPSSFCPIHCFNSARKNLFVLDPYSELQSSNTQVAFRQSNIRIISRLLYVATRSSQKLSCSKKHFRRPDCACRLLSACGIASS